jgi:hypothetical protein
LVPIVSAVLNRILRWSLTPRVKTVAEKMERNKWETAIRCLEIAVHPNTSNDEVVAAINGFRRTASGAPLSQMCIEFACGGLALADLAQIKEMLERLQRENLELRRKLVVEEAAQINTAQRLDTAFGRIHELTLELAAAHLRADTAEQEFAAFRAAYARIVDGMKADKAGLQAALDEARQRAVDRAVLPASPSFAGYLTEARLRAAPGSPFPNGSGRLPKAEPDPKTPWIA